MQSEPVKQALLRWLRKAYPKLTRQETRDQYIKMAESIKLDNIK